MKIKILPGSDLPSKELKIAIDELIARFNEYLEPVAESENSGRIKDCKNKPCCLLEFFYFYDSLARHVNGYKNGIWIHVNNKNIWLYVHINGHNRKKVSIISGSDLKCKSFPQIESGYICLPPNFRDTSAYYERLRVTDMSYTELLNAIIARLQCVCDA